MVSNLPILVPASDRPDAQTEVFNTYGARLSNATLLARYGFLLEGNEWDQIEWGWAELLEVVRRKRDEGEEATRSFVHRYRAMVAAWPAWEGWKGSELVYEPSLDDTGSRSTLERRDPADIEVAGRERELQANINADGKVSHHLWIFCAMLAGFMDNVTKDDLRRIAEKLLESEQGNEVDEDVGLSVHGGIWTASGEESFPSIDLRTQDAPDSQGQIEGPHQRSALDETCRAVDWLCRARLQSHKGGKLSTEALCSMIDVRSSP